MDEEKLIQVSFQLPPSALDSLSRLAEQLRMLTEATGRAAKAEREENDLFDPERFMALRRGTDPTPKAVEAAVSDIGDAQAVSTAISQTENASAVSASVREAVPDAVRAGDTLYEHPEPIVETGPSINPQRTPQEGRDDPPLPAEAERTQLNTVPSAQAEVEGVVPDAPEAGRYVDQQIPDAESARAEAEERASALAAVHGEVSGSIETPLGAGVVIQTQPEMPASRWSDVTEELVIPGPAPLTAEAVSLAFERDGRRYDNGFPLY